MTYLYNRKAKRLTLLASLCITLNTFAQTTTETFERRDADGNPSYTHNKSTSFTTGGITFGLGGYLQIVSNRGLRAGAGASRSFVRTVVTTGFDYPTTSFGTIAVDSDKSSHRGFQLMSLALNASNDYGTKGGDVYQISFEIELVGTQPDGTEISEQLTVNAEKDRFNSYRSSYRWGSITASDLGDLAGKTLVSLEFRRTSELSKLKYIGIDNFQFQAITLPPTIDVNTGLTVSRGDAAPITSAQLFSSGAVQTPAELIYTIQSGAAVAHGTLYRDENNNGSFHRGIDTDLSSVGSTFTQQDINNGRVYYLHDDSENLSDQFDFIVRAGTQRSKGTASFHIAITPNAVPTLSDLDASRAYTENDPPVLLDGNAAISDAEYDALNGGDGNYAGASLTLFNAGALAPRDINDILDFADFASRTGLTRNSAGNIEKGGNVIAVVSADPGLLTLTFTAANGSIPTTADVNAILQRIRYSNSSDNETRTHTDIGYRFNDGRALARELEVIRVNITTINDAPTLSGAASLTAIDENVKPKDNQGDRIIDLIGQLTYADAESGDPKGIAVVGIDNRNGKWQYKMGSGAWKDFGNDPVITAGNATLLKGDDNNKIRFLPNPHFWGNPSPSMTIRAWDGTSGSDGDENVDIRPGGGAHPFSTGTAILRITVNIVNTAPVFSNLDAAPFYTENDPPVLLDGDATISDVDYDSLNGRNGNYAGAVLTLDRQGGVTAEDVFGFADKAGLSLRAGKIRKGGKAIAIFDTSTAGRLTLTFTAANGSIPTTADVNAILRGINYSNSSDDPPSTVSIDYSFRDEVADVQGSITVTIRPVNDAPDFGRSTASFTAIDEDVPGGNNPGDLVQDILTRLTYGDKDYRSSSPRGLAITAVSSDHGTWQYRTGTGWQAILPVSEANALLLSDAPANRIRFKPNPNYNGIHPEITVRAWDGTDGSGNGGRADAAVNGDPTAFSAATATVDIMVNPVNDKPSFTFRASPNQSNNSSEGRISIRNFIASTTFGPANESAQRVAEYTVSTNRGALFFSIDPAIANNGTLSYTLAVNAHGTATVTVRLRDSGGTARGGVDISDPQTFTITVRDNQAPGISSSATTATTSNITLSLNLNESARVYYLLRERGGRPSKALISDKTGGKNADIARNFQYTGPGVQTHTITGLIQNKKYYLFWYAQDEHGNQTAIRPAAAADPSAVNPALIKTSQDLTAPGFNDALTTISNTTRTSFQINVRLTGEAGKVFYVVSALGAPAPIADQVVDGIDGAKRVPVARGVIGVPSTNELESAVVGFLQPGTSYTIYLAAQDIYGNKSAVETRTVRTQPPAAGGATDVVITKPPALALCVGEAYTKLGNIKLQEARAGRSGFEDQGRERTLILSLPEELEFNTDAIVTLKDDGGNDDWDPEIHTVVPIVASNTITIAYTVNGKSYRDELEIVGLELRANRRFSGTKSLLRTGGDARITGIPAGGGHAFANFTTPEASPPPATEALTYTYCEGATVAAADFKNEDSYRWYTDFSLTNLEHTGELTAPEDSLGFDVDTPGTTTLYLTNKEPDKCESSPVQVDIVVNPNPKAAAGSPKPVCASDKLNIGAFPTLVETGALGTHTYQWRSNQTALSADFNTGSLPAGWTTTAFFARIPLAFRGDNAIKISAGQHLTSPKFTPLDTGAVLFFYARLENKGRSAEIEVHLSDDDFKNSTELKSVSLDTTVYKQFAVQVPLGDLSKEYRIRLQAAGAAVLIDELVLDKGLTNAAEAVKSNPSFIPPSKPRGGGDLRYNIDLTIIDPNGCSSPKTSAAITVHDKISPTIAVKDKSGNEVTSVGLNSPALTFDIDPAGDEAPPDPKVGFTGAGVVYNPSEPRYQFNPSAAGKGTHNIAYTARIIYNEGDEDEYKCEESARASIEVVENRDLIDRDGQPLSIADMCINAEAVVIKASSALIEQIENSNSTFSHFTYYDNESLDSIAGSATTITIGTRKITVTSFLYNPALQFDKGGRGSRVIKVVTTANESGGTPFEKEITARVYGIPEFQFSDLDAQICEGDNKERELKVKVRAGDDFELLSDDKGTYEIETGDALYPKITNKNLEIEGGAAGIYTIRYSSNADNDPNQVVNGLGCTVTIEQDVEVIAKPDKPILSTKSYGFDPEGKGNSNPDEKLALNNNLTLNTNGVYRFTYCQRDNIPDIYLDFADTDGNKEQDVRDSLIFQWFKGRDPRTAVKLDVGASDGRFVTEADLFPPDDEGIMTIDTGRHIFHVSQFVKKSAGFEGCESEKRKIVIKIIGTPEIPEVITADNPVERISSKYYVAQYCSETLVEDIAVSNPDDDIVWFSDAKGTTPIANTDDTDNVLTAAEMRLKGPGTYDFYYTKSAKDKSAADFKGCRGLKYHVQVVIYAPPAPPVSTAQFDTSIYHCAGAVKPKEDQLRVPADYAASSAWYEWYDAAAGGTGLGANDIYYSSVTGFDPEAAGVTTLYVEKIAHIKKRFGSGTEAKSTTFPGCKSETRTPVRIEVFANPARPTVTANTGGSTPEPIPNDVTGLSGGLHREILVCAGEITVDYRFDTETSYPSAAANLQRYNWYESTVDDRGRYIGAFDDPTVLQPEFGIDPNPTNEDGISHYFYITQTTDSIAGEHAGCTSAPTILALTIRPIPGSPTGKTAYKFCEEEDGIIESGYSVGSTVAGTEYTWYKPSTLQRTGVGDSVVGASPTGAQLGFRKDAATQKYPTGAYPFRVTQTTNINTNTGAGKDFLGCESTEYLEVTVNINALPEPSIILPPGGVGAGNNEFCIDFNEGKLKITSSPELDLSTDPQEIGTFSRIDKDGITMDGSFIDNRGDNILTAAGNTATIDLRAAFNPIAGEQGMHPAPVQPMHPIPVQPMHPIPVQAMHPIPVQPMHPTPVQPMDPIPVQAMALTGCRGWPLQGAGDGPYRVQGMDPIGCRRWPLQGAGDAAYPLPMSTLDAAENSNLRYVNYTLRYTYTDGNECTSEVDAVIVINNTPEPEFSIKRNNTSIETAGEPALEVCIDDPSEKDADEEDKIVLLDSTPTEMGILREGIFTGVAAKSLPLTNALERSAEGKYYFYPAIAMAEAEAGNDALSDDTYIDFTIKYTFTNDAEGCTGKTPKTIRVYRLPKPVIKIKKGNNNVDEDAVCVVKPGSGSADDRDANQVVIYRTGIGFNDSVEKDKDGNPIKIPGEGYYKATLQGMTETLSLKAISSVPKGEGDTIRIDSKLAYEAYGDGLNPLEISIAYTYETEKQCAGESNALRVTINPLPTLDFTFRDPTYGANEFCIHDPDITLNAKALQGNGSDTTRYSPVKEGVFSSQFGKIGVGLTKSTEFLAAFNFNTAYGYKTTEENKKEGYEEGYGSEAEHNITYTFTEDKAGGCKNYIMKPIIINPRPVVKITTPGGCDGKEVVFKFDTVANKNLGVAIDSAVWNLGDVNRGGTGGTEETKHNVYADPGKLYAVTDYEGNSLLYPVYTYAEAGSNFEVTLRVKNEKQCWSTEIGEEINIDNNPDVNFTTTQSLCASEVVFKTSYTKPEDLKTFIGTIDAVKFDFKDGTAPEWKDYPNPNSEPPNRPEYKHTYTDRGTYDVTLTMKTGNGCERSYTSSVTTRPMITLVSGQEKLFTFEKADTVQRVFTNRIGEKETVVVSADDWYVDLRPIQNKRDSDYGKLPSEFNSWRFGIPPDAPPGEVEIKADVIRGDTVRLWMTTEKPDTVILSNDGIHKHVWMTNLRGDYLSGETRSFVYSPCFNIAKLDRPMVSFDQIYHFPDKDRDGVVFQYSTSTDDEGSQIWLPLGRYEPPPEADATGAHWFNSDNISSRPGQQTGKLYGWTGNKGDRKAAWVTAKHKLDAIKEKEQVIFRFALSSDGSKESAGFAFDNFRIKSREKQILLEQFSSLNSKASKDWSETINDFLDDRSINYDDVIPINYHTKFEGKEQLNTANEADPSARALFYGIAQVPSSVLDGVVRSDGDTRANTRTKSAPRYNANDIARSSMEDALFDMQIEIENDSVRAKATAKKDIKSDEPIDPNKRYLALYIAIVEEDVPLVDANAEPLQSRHVLRKMLPNGLGKRFTAQRQDPITDQYLITSADTPFESKQPWEIPKGINTDTDSLVVVAFIQDLNTKEVFQAAQIKVPVDKQVPIVTGIEDDLGEDYQLYPNPASREVFILLDQKASETMTWKVLDQTGRVYRTGRLKAGVKGFSLDTKQFPSGMYLISITGKQDKFKNKKLLIAH